MKTIELIFKVVVFQLPAFFFGFMSMGQCSISLDPILPFCDESTYPFPIAESLVITGGVEPYTFNWQCPVFWVLDDPTSAAPNLVSGNENTDVIISLTLTDATGQTCQSETKVDYSGFDVITEFCPCLVLFEGPVSEPVCLMVFAEHLPATYSWAPAELFDNPNVPNPIITITEPTSWTVTITDAHGCSRTYLCEYFGLNVTENETLSRLTISPNPATNQLNIILPPGGNRAEVYSLSGQLVMSQFVYPGWDRAAIDVSGLSGGMYMVRVVKESGEMMGVGRFVKE